MKSKVESFFCRRLAIAKKYMLSYQELSLGDLKEAQQLPNSWSVPRITILFQQTDLEEATWKIVCSISRKKKLFVNDPSLLGL